MIKTVVADNTGAYTRMLTTVYHYPEYTSAPRGAPIREVLNYQLTIEAPSSQPITTADDDRNKIIEEYTEKELEWYLDGDRSAASAPSAFWKTLADNEGNINSNYGHLVMRDHSEGNDYEGKLTPWQWAVDRLRRDTDTRQAVMRYNKPRHSYVHNKDFPCTMYQNFHIRDDKLHSTVRMRSSDLFVGVVYDLPWFSYMMERMCGLGGMNMGTLTFSSDSLHIYDKDLPAIRKMLNIEEQL